MIEVKNRMLCVPDEERSIGCVADNEIEVRQFLVTDAAFFDFTFQLDLENGIYADVVPLEKEETEGGVLLTWKIKAENLQYPGRLRAQIRAFSEAGEVWHSQVASFLVADSIYAPGTFPPIPPSEYEFFQNSLQALLKKTEAIEKGEGEDSLLMAGAGHSFADHGISAGPGCVAGRRGYYIKSIDAEKKKIYLSAEKAEAPAFTNEDNTDADFPTPAYEVGDYISIISGSHYYFCATIAAIKNNVITYDGDLGFEFFNEDTEQDGHSLYVPTKPEVGAVAFGMGGFVAGESCKGNGRGAFLGGRGNVGANYATIGGRENRGGYGVGIFGTYNFVPGLGSHGGGNRNEIWGRYSLFSGNGNYIAYSALESEISGKGNRIETPHTRGGGINCESRGGRVNTFHGEDLDIEGSFNDIEGRGHRVRGDFNFVRGDHLIALGGQVVLGAYNAEDPDKLVILGGGTAGNRKNILTIDKDGNLSAPNITDAAAMQEQMLASCVAMAEFSVQPVMRGLTEALTVSKRMSMLGAKSFRVYAGDVLLFEEYTPLGESIRSAYKVFSAEGTEIALYDAGGEELCRARMAPVYADEYVQYGILERQ